MGELPCRAIRPLLSAWLDGELPRAESEAVNRHCDACHGCRAERRGLANVRSLCRSLPERAMPGDLPARAVEHAGGRWRRTAAAGTAVAVMLGLLSGAAFSLGGQPPDARVVHVPMDAFVADHLVHTVNGPVTTPALGDGTP